MPAWWQDNLKTFLATSDSQIIGALSRAHASEGYQAQISSATWAWESQLTHLRQFCTELINLSPVSLHWHLLLEFVIPRKERRIDVILLAESKIFILESKASAVGRAALEQVDQYALLLHFFHRPSAKQRIYPLVVSSDSSAHSLRDPRQQEMALLETAAYWIHPAIWSSWEALAKTVMTLSKQSSGGNRIDPGEFNRGEYFPVPSIIDAARQLQSGLSIREIAHSRAAKHDVEKLSRLIHEHIEIAKQEKRHVICFITGVPGSGKTLVGLSLAFQSRGDGDALHFMSGNGPLVMVMKALFKDFQMKRGVSAKVAEIEAGTLIEDVHVFAKEYTKDNPHVAPSNNVVIFDEAQRAWNLEQSYLKFKRETSEPAMFLRIMERHQNWAVIVALVGGGQEINSGEAGLAEWGRALAASEKRWQVWASPEVIDGGTSVAGTSLLEDPDAKGLNVRSDDRLHLMVPVRSLGADETYAHWVNAVVSGDAATASQLKRGGFPVYLTRDLAELKLRLLQQRVGESRIGLVASSKASRLRAEGLEPDGAFHKRYRWDRWYLAPRTDVRSSERLEVFATEFEIQGLELDWIGLLWGGDMIWSSKDGSWHTRRLSLSNEVTKWSQPQLGDHRIYRLNSYRVLLTRARQGIIIFVPRGESADLTRSPKEMDATAQFLLDCGISPVSELALRMDSGREPPALF